MSKVETYRPIPYRPGCRVVRKWLELFEDRVGNKAILYKLDYTNPKGKLIEGYTLRVKWLYKN